MARKMKNSGIEWIGEIPAEWEIRRIKTLFQLRNEKSFKPLNEVNLISLYTDKGVLQHSDIEYVAGNKASNADGYKCVYEDDIVVNIILCWMGAIGRSAYTGVTSPAYDIYKPCPGTDSRFYHYYFRTKGFNGECFQRGRGIMLMRWRTYAEDFMDIKVCFPSLPEQQQIADYLDKKVSEIDSTISKTRESIEEYKKLKQAIITEAVTKGLNPNAKMKNSGIEWIGEIPEEWEVRALKSLFHIFSGTTPKSDNPEFWDEDIKWVTPADFSTENVFISGGKRNLSKKGLKSYALEIIPRGSLIFSKRAPIGKVCINTDEMCTNQGCLACVKKVNLDIKFFYYLLSVFTELFELLGSGTTFKEISLSAFSDFRLPVPPLTSQLSLITYLDQKCSEIDNLITKKEQLVVELESYKKSLIYEVVTGKREV